VSGAPPSGEPTPAAADQAEHLPTEQAGEAEQVPQDVLGDEVRGALAELDGVELADHPQTFEALSEAILAELRDLEEL
jgi:hypothetical protein